MAKPRIVIIGAGLGGTIAAYEIKAAVKGRADVLMIADDAKLLAEIKAKGMEVVEVD